MCLQAIGAGLDRTGTFSLKVAIERLLDGPRCHMIDVSWHPQHIPGWRGALYGEQTDRHVLLGNRRAAGDEPPAAFWRELHEAFPPALARAEWLARVGEAE